MITVGDFLKSFVKYANETPNALVYTDLAPWESGNSAYCYVKSFMLKDGAVLLDCVNEDISDKSCCLDAETILKFLREQDSSLKLLVNCDGESFVLVSESGGYGLYGPPLNDEYKSILAPEPKQYEKHRYDVIVRATSELLGQNVEIQMVPLLVVKHFCESNKDITWKDLQIAFDTVECHMPKYLDWITPKPIVEAYYSSFPPPGGNPIRLFHDDPIHLASGETILVVSRFMFNNLFDFSSFLKVADNLGYEIREQ